MAAAATAVLVVLLLFFAAMPVDAGSEDAERNRYRAQFYGRLPGVPPHTVGTVYTDGTSFEATIDEMATMYADRAVETAKVAEERRQQKGGADRGGRDEPASAQGAVLAAGEFLLWERLDINNGNPSVACSDLQDNAHYTVAIEIQDSSYVGAAYSDVSAQPGGYGILDDYTTGNVQSYSTPVYYSGHSNFFCIEYPSAGNSMTLVNQPQVWGGFLVGAEP